MAGLSMSKHEFSRLDVLLRVQSGRLRVADACALMALHRRQVFRLLRDSAARASARFVAIAGGEWLRARTTLLAAAASSAVCADRTVRATRLAACQGQQ